MEKFEMVAKTLAGLEEVLAEELRGLGAENVEPGRRMVAFEGDKAMLYKANLCSRTALRILKPFYKFVAHTPDELYEQTKEYDWGSVLSLDKTFCIDTVAYSDDFTHSHFVTYRVKDAIVDWFRDKYGADKRPGVRLKDADVMIHVHISGGNVTLSLDSSGESLHKRGYRTAQTEAPINEVLAAGIILMSGYRGDCPFVDPMCGSGTFLIEAALIAANINPGIYRKHFAFENWPDFDRELFDSIYNDDSEEREPAYPIIGADISPAAIEIATQNAKSAGVSKYIKLEVKPLAHWEEAPQPAGILVTNPPYGERISVPDMEGLYTLIGNRLKMVFQGYHAWVIGYKDEYFQKIGLAPSKRVPLYNGALECTLCEYIIFEGDKRSFLASGGKIKHYDESDDEQPRHRKDHDRKPRRDGDDRDFRHGKDDRKPRRDGDRKFGDRDRKFGDRDRKFGDRKFGDGERKEKRAGHFTERRDKFDDKPRRFEDRDDRPRRFGDRDDKPRRFEDRDDRPRRYDDRRDFAQETEENDNPLAKRRNPEALKWLQNKQPELPPTEGPTMRIRKKKGM